MGANTRLEKKTASAATAMNVEPLPRAALSRSTVVDDDAPVMVSPPKRAGMANGAVVCDARVTVMLLDSPLQAAAPATAPASVAHVRVAPAKHAVSLPPVLTYHARDATLVEFKYEPTAGGCTPAYLAIAPKHEIVPDTN